MIQLSAVILPYHYGCHVANVAQRRSCCLPSFCHITTVVMWRMLHRDDPVVCRHSAILLRSSCGECCTETILLSAVFLSYHYSRHVANVAQRRSCCLPSFCHITTVVMWRMLHRDDPVVCRHSVISLRLSCGECCTETILLSAVILSYHYGRHVANVAQRRFCCLPSFCHITTVVMWRMLHRDDPVVCRHSVISLRLSCGECCTETILLSAVILTYGSSRQATHIVLRGFCCQSSF